MLITYKIIYFLILYIMRFAQKLFNIVWKYKLIWAWFWWINHQKTIKVEFIQKFLWFKKTINYTNKVYFDLYNKADNEHKYIWFANISEDWICLWYKKRNEIRKMIENHFKSEYVVGNYRNYFDK